MNKYKIMADEIIVDALLRTYYDFYNDRLDKKAKYVRKKIEKILEAHFDEEIVHKEKKERDACLAGFGTIMEEIIAHNIDFYK